MLDKLAHLSCVFKRCLHLESDAYLIERSLEELRDSDPKDLNAYFETEAQLAPLLYWHLRQRKLTSLLKQPLAAILASRYHENAARNFLFEQYLQKILSRFRRDGIDVLVLKGASVFTKGLSHFRDAFVLCDLDLLVKPDDMQRATELLVSNGYSLTEGQSMEGLTKQGFLGRNNFTRIDLHSALFWSGVRLKYSDYFRSDVWKAPKIDSIGGEPTRVLSVEDQICYRLVHDALGHERVLLNNLSRLYYLCALVRFYERQVNWQNLIENVATNTGGRLLLAYFCYGQRELGFPFPRELEAYRRQAFSDLAYLDAISCASNRLKDYSHRTFIAVLGGSNLQQRTKKVFSLLGNSPSMSHSWTRMLKKFCLQMAAILYVNAYTLRKSIWRKEHVA